MALEVVAQLELVAVAGWLAVAKVAPSLGLVELYWLQPQCIARQLSL